VVILLFQETLNKGPEPSQADIIGSGVDHETHDLLRRGVIHNQFQFVALITLIDPNATTGVEIRQSLQESLHDLWLSPSDRLPIRRLLGMVDMAVLCFEKLPISVMLLRNDVSTPQRQRKIALAPFESVGSHK
jgi:hypothetical protein